jgi:hypothetical protein
MQFLILRARELKAGDVYLDDDVESLGLVHRIKIMPTQSGYVTVLEITLPISNPNDTVPDEWVITDTERRFQVVRFNE